MKKEYIFGIIGFLIGGVLVWIFANNAVNSNNNSMMRMMGMHQRIESSQKVSQLSDSHMMPDGSMMKNMNGMTMDDMTNSLRDKNGKEFDIEFVNQMIVHHEGAVEMAKLSESQASSEEIKNLSREIIEAQTAEIEMMRGWLFEWQ